MTACDAGAYEAAQNYSPVTAWLHGLRYAHLLRTARSLAPTQSTPLRVLELGCAYGKAYEVLDAQLPTAYIGVDQHGGFVAEAQRRYAGKGNFRAFEQDAVTFVAGGAAALGPFDLVFALETLEHMAASQVVRLLEHVAALRPRVFTASVPVEVGPAILLKNLGSAITGYWRHKEYTLAETLWASIGRLDRIAPHAGGHKGFDWRWLVHTIHQVMPVRSIERFPVNFLPAACATSVYITAAPRVE